SSVSFGTYQEWSKAFDGVELVPTSGLMEKLRMYKDASELAIIREALGFGAAYKGYNSDITRTLSVGEPDPKLKEIYDIVLRAQIAGVEALKPGVTGKEADAVTLEIITAAGYGDAYGHSAGHGLGVEV
ncbi:aminopeptidase P family protein, partial [Anoxybacillus sp. LAT_38]|nr:aminopeptidase P family protein [Anoxybacillus sp. LAT_38]